MSVGLIVMDRLREIGEYLHCDTPNKSKESGRLIDILNCMMP
jgi:hypothetical protein